MGWLDARVFADSGVGYMDMDMEMGESENGGEYGMFG